MEKEDVMQKDALRILMISGAFYPRVDGSVIAVSNLLKCLQERGHDIHLLTRRLHRTMPEEKWQDVLVVRLGPGGKSPISRLILSLNQVRVGLNFIRKEKVDVIHVHGAHSLLAGLFLGMLFHRPIIVTFHGFQRLWFRNARWKPELTLTFTYPLVKKLIERVDAVIAQSRTLKEVIKQLYKIDPQKIHVVPHVIDEARFKFVPDPPSKKAIVLFVGTLARVHGVDLLVKAAPTILKDSPQTKFLIVGKGPQRQSLQELIEDLNLEKSVFLVGPVLDQGRLAKYYAAASVVVVPLKYRGYILSLVALEAMSTGRPVVTTMTLDSELRKYGVFKAGFDSTALARVIKDILSLRKREYLEIAASARKYIEGQCSKERVGSLMEKLYIRLLSNKGDIIEVND